ncbi:response regulator [Lyngbya sp. PCC 8106]|uniref:response regulator n=1 Tax=Lyngbya sp. (strain PCC 8106) TaxID=313612 RepID=UPI0000EAC734|nr:response regulator [Lyngbya sp. PCC 8106]EAW38712.1 adenylate/guanylate cyclase [Lyngbya sp. PCC 8106]
MSDHLHQILIVDDEPANLILLEELLKSEGYEILLAASGIEALQLAKTTSPDLVLLDVMMPEMDGFEVCDSLRKDEQLKVTPVIFLTSLDDEQSQIKGLELMGDDYITKPFNSRLLLAKVSSLLQLNQMRTQTTQVDSQRISDDHNEGSVSVEVDEDASEKLRLFVPEQFLERIAPQGVNSIKLGNFTEEELTILFCDIRGFTTIAESQTASETYQWLNVFFNQMSLCIDSNYGFIDKYLGDAIMAVFDREQFHQEDALNAAIIMQRSLEKFNEDRDQFQIQEPLKIGIGINTGIGMIGTLGSESRMDSTVIGDVVNTASRLEGLTKSYGCKIIVSEETIFYKEQSLEKTALTDAKFTDKSETNSSSFYYRWLDKVAPRGKQKAIKIYELFGNQSHLIDSDKTQTLTLFENGVEAWQTGELTQALLYFKQVIEQDPTDIVAELYIQRCQEQLKVDG